MTNDKLDEMTDAQLNELFAVEVAGARKDGTLFIDREGAVMVPRSYNYCASADAVLPWLEKHTSLQRMKLSENYAAVPEYGAPKVWHVTIIVSLGGSSFTTTANAYGTASTFARAAVIALIRAKRAAV